MKKSGLLGMILLSISTLLACSSGEELNFIYFYSDDSDKIAEIVKQNLDDIGVNVKLTPYSNYSNFVKAMDEGDFDINLSGWSNIIGSPEYTLSNIMHSKGDFNKGVVDFELDAKINSLSNYNSNTNEYKDIISDINTHISDNAYKTPIITVDKTIVTNKTVDSIEESIDKYTTFNFNKIVSNEDELKLSTGLLNLSTLHPLLRNDSSASLVMTNIYNRLINIDELGSLSVIDSLSKSHFTCKNEHYFELNDNQTFSNGDKITTDDVIFSINRALGLNEEFNNDYNYTKSRIFTDIISIEKVNSIPNCNNSVNVNNLLKVNVNGNDNTINALAHFTASIISEKSVLKSEEDGLLYGDINNLSYLNCSNQYCIESFNNNTLELVSRNEEFVDKIVIEQISSNQTEFLAIKDGSVDMSYTISPFYLQELREDKNINIYSVEGNAFTYMYYNYENIDVDLRKRIDNAVNKDMILDLVIYNQGNIRNKFV